jgi:hypothetical protein
VLKLKVLLTPSQLPRFPKPRQFLLVPTLCVGTINPVRQLEITAIMNKLYQTPSDWYRANRHQLKSYRGQWIAFTKAGVIAHHRNFNTMMAHLDPNGSDYVVERIFENEFIDPPNFCPLDLERLRNTNGNLNMRCN